MYRLSEAKWEDEERCRMYCEMIVWEENNGTFEGGQVV